MAMALIGAGFCTTGRTGESLTLFLLSVSSVATTNASLATLVMRVWVVFLVALGAGRGVGCASSSLEGTSKISIVTGGEAGEAVLDVELLATLFTFLGSGTEVTLGDLEGSNSLCLSSGVCDRCASDVNLYSGMRLRAAFPYVAIRFRGATACSSVAMMRGCGKESWWRGKAIR